MVREQWLSARGWRTFCKIKGDIFSSTPIIVVHGGPGFSSDYLESLDILHEQYGIPLIHYDQYGCGRSSKEEDGILPSLDTYATQLSDVLLELMVDQNYILLGHSAGGMIAVEHACTRPKGLRGLILANAFASLDLFVRNVQQLRADLIEVIRNSPNMALAPGQSADPELVFFERHVCRTKPVPDPLLRTLAASVQNRSVFARLWGTSPFNVTGSYSGWSAIDRLTQIGAPTLAYRGQYDEVGAASFSPLEAIPDVRLEIIGDASHVPHLEVPDRTCQLIAEFIEARCR